MKYVFIGLYYASAAVFCQAFITLTGWNAYFTSAAFWVLIGVFTLAVYRLFSLAFPKPIKP